MAAWKQLLLVAGHPARGGGGMGAVLSRRARDPRPLGHRLGAGRSHAPSREALPATGVRARRRAPDRGRHRASGDAATINDRFQAIGTGRANASVTVNPYTSGRLTEIRGAFPARASRRARSSPGWIPRPRRSRSTAPRSRCDDAAGQARADQVAAHVQHRHAVQMTEAELALGNARLALRDAELALDTPLDRRADRRHRRHPADRGRQLRHHRNGDRHGRRPLQHHRRFLGAGTLRRAP